MSEFGQGLALSGIGILVTFSALGILILLIFVLKALFPVNRDEIAPSFPEETLSKPEHDREELLKKAAAAGVAILLDQKLFAGQSRLGSVLESPVGKWWQRGLDRIHSKE